MSFKADAQRSEDGALSEAILETGMAVLGRLMAIARKYSCVASCGVATEVFRTAPNGAAFLRNVELELGLAVTVISQQAEAELGLATAEGYNGQHPDAGVSATGDCSDADDVIAWDSGGGSFHFLC